MSTTTIYRASMQKVCSLVRPALATADYIPALTHIQFKDGFASAYNDLHAIVVPAPDSIERCVPGELFMKTLGSLGGDSVALTFDPATNVLLVASGRSRIKLPTLPTKNFPFEVPTTTGPEIVLSPDIVKGIEMCLVSMNKDGTYPAQCGVTLEAENDRAVLYSTDGVTMSRFQTADVIELPGQAPVILPAFICEQLVSLMKAFPETTPILVLLPGALLVDFTSASTNNTIASIFSKTLIDTEPVDFGKVFKRYCNPATAAELMRPIPDPLDTAFSRALLVLGQEAEKTTNVTLNDGHMDLFTTSNMGDVDDDMPFDSTGPLEFKVDPAMVVRGLKHCSKIAFLKGALLMGDEKGSFIHMVSHIKVKKSNVVPQQ